ncbi:MAG TPA: L,D-transpeptidase family protein, partial [Thermomicrobiales bacterium]|nr:L,D-transpeptidase family protein [Thermomicrobiales bacterium]
TRAAIAPGSARAALSAAPKGSGRFFAESGHSLSGEFLDFWEDHGDLPLIGMPTSEAFRAKATGLQTQVFERAVLEVDRGTIRFQPITRLQTEANGMLGDPAYAPTPPISGTTQLVKSPEGLRLRSLPNLEAEIRVLLPDNAEFIAAAAESGNWYAGYADGYSGYLASQYLTVAPALPAISLQDWDTSVWQGAALGETNVRSSPTTESEIADVLEYGDDVVVTQWLEGEEVFTGADLWARVGNNRYIYARNIGRNAPVAAPPLPANAPSVGKWIDVNLTQQLMVAYNGRDVDRVVVMTSGMAGWETPEGTWQILVRVANETMESKSIGAEHYFKLEDVLFTQYFTDLGHAIHYAWWRTEQTIGRPGSHGCLNTLLDDATYFWNWATIGTPVITHY